MRNILNILLLLVMLFLGTLDNHHLDLCANDTERVRLTNTGHLLVGSTTDNGAKLQVNGDFSLADGGSSLTAFSNGSVGIGATSAMYFVTPYMLFLPPGYT